MTGVIENGTVNQDHEIIAVTFNVTPKQYGYQSKRICLQLTPSMRIDNAPPGKVATDQSVRTVAPCTSGTVTDTGRWVCFLLFLTVLARFNHKAISSAQVPNKKTEQQKANDLSRTPVREAADDHVVGAFWNCFWLLPIYGTKSTLVYNLSIHSSARLVMTVKCRNALMLLPRHLSVLCLWKCVFSRMLQARGMVKQLIKKYLPVSSSYFAWQMHTCHPNI